MKLFDRKKLYAVLFLLSIMRAAALDIRDVNGGVFCDAEVLKVTAGGLQIRYSGGVVLLDPEYIAPACRGSLEPAIAACRELKTRQDREIRKELEERRKKVGFTTVVPVSDDDFLRIRWSMTAEELLKSGASAIPWKKNFYEKHEKEYIFASDGGLKEVRIRYREGACAGYLDMCRHADSFYGYYAFTIMKESGNYGNRMAFFGKRGEIYYAVKREESGGGHDITICVYNSHYYSHDQIVANYVFLN